VIRRWRQWRRRRAAIRELVAAYRAHAATSTLPDGAPLVDGNHPMIATGARCIRARRELLASYGGQG
jgi:hypothetical protein